MSLLLSELILRHEGVVRRPTNQLAGADGTAAVPEGTEFLGEANLLKLLSDLVLHLPACATSIHRSDRGLVRVWGGVGCVMGGGRRVDRGGVVCIRRVEVVNLFNPGACSLFCLVP